MVLDERMNKRKEIDRDSERERELQIYIERGWESEL